MSAQLGWVYFIGCAALGAMKIGYSGVDPRRRRSTLQIGCPAKLEILDFFEGPPELERKFHAAFAALRISGEWFRHEGKLRDFLFYLDRPEGEAASAALVERAIFDVLDQEWPSHPADPLGDAAYAASGSTAPFLLESA